MIWITIILSVINEDDGYPAHYCDCIVLFIFQGEIFRTRGGGTAVQFTDVEVLKHSKPQTPRPLPRRSIRLANRKQSANNSNSSNSSISDISNNSCESSTEWTDVETRVSSNVVRLINKAA